MDGMGWAAKWAVLEGGRQTLSPAGGCCSGDRCPLGGEREEDKQRS